jgi:dephospho-CoA kinase
VKLDLAARVASTSEYAEAKEPWFARIATRAEDWAARTGWQPPPT